MSAQPAETVDVADDLRRILDEVVAGAQAAVTPRSKVTYAAMWAAGSISGGMATAAVMSALAR